MIGYIYFGNEKAIKVEYGGGLEPAILTVIEDISQDLQKRAKNLIDRITTQGIKDYDKNNGSVVLPQQGETFIKNIRKHLTSPYIHFSTV